MRKIRSGFKCFVVGIAMCELLIALLNAAQQTATAPKESFDVGRVEEWRHARRSGLSGALRFL